ncbi:MAG TPA: helix-turn-helix domain-containing protein [Clostridiaceae bacterium]|nr:helix-turn-helix domain-containing protein [Clostridiaceae bacterium]
MIINDLLKQRNMSKYRLAKNSKVPYTTLNDICNGKTNLKYCNADTVYRLALELGVSMETLLEPCYEVRPSFELFKSHVCHRLNQLGDIEFICQILESDIIRNYFKKKWYPESLYLLAMVDYVSRVNDVMLCSDYDDLRKYRLSETLFPSSVIALSIVTKDDEVKRAAMANAIPEFLRFNIVESEVRSIV